MREEIKTLQFENDVLQYIQEVLEQLVGRSSPIERDLYIKQIASETNISEEAIYAQFRKLEANNAKTFKRAEQGNIQTKQIELQTKNLYLQQNGQNDYYCRICL
jgi:DNA primase (EC 2.7.7.-)